MSLLKTYSLTEIGQCLKDEKYPISGITELGSTEFHFKEPSEYLGVALHNGSRIRPESTYSKYREFHALLELIVRYILEFHNTVVMFDIHSFC